MKLVATSRFDRELGRLLKKQPMVAPRVEKTLKLLSVNPRHPSLRLHKVSSKGAHSVSVNMRLRIVFFDKGDERFLLRIGAHEEVY